MCAACTRAAGISYMYRRGHTGFVDHLRSQTRLPDTKSCLLRTAHCIIRPCVRAYRCVSVERDRELKVKINGTRAHSLTAASETRSTLGRRAAVDHRGVQDVQLSRDVCIHTRGTRSTTDFLIV